MTSSRVTRLGASLLLNLVLTAGLTSAAFGASPVGPSTGTSATGASPAVPATHNITGKVTGTGAVALQNIYVEALGSSNYAYTAADGTYSVSVPAGTYRLYLYDSTGSYLTGYYDSSGSGDFTIAYASATPIVVTTADVTGKNVQLGTGRYIKGTVTGTGAVALANIHVEAFSPNYSGYAVTAGDGTYSVLVPASDSYTVHFVDRYGAYLPGYYDSAGSGHFTLAQGSATLVVVGTSDVTGKSVQMVAAPPWSVTLGVSATSVTVGTAVTLTATASEDVGPTYYYIVILDSHNAVVTYCGDGTTCVTSPGVTSTAAGSKTYHAVVGTENGTSPVATSATRTVTWQAGAATHLSVGTFNPYPAGVSHSVTVKALDAYGNVAVGYLGTIHFTSSDTHATLPADYTFTSADKGVHTFTGGLTLKTAGSQWFRATDKATASITGSQSVTVTPGAAKTLSVGTFNPYPAGVTHSVTVKALDAYGNTATGYLGTIHFTSSDTKATLPADYTFTSADKGVHTFTGGLVLKTAGSEWVRATDKTTASITGTQTVTVT